VLVWLALLRWGTVLAVLAVLLLAFLLDQPLLPVTPLIAVPVLVHVATGRRVRRLKREAIARRLRNLPPGPKPPD
jgi:hypothetical protein